MFETACDRYADADWQNKSLKPNSVTIIEWALREIFNRVRIWQVVGFNDVRRYTRQALQIVLSGVEKQSHRNVSIEMQWSSNW